MSVLSGDLAWVPNGHRQPAIEKLGEPTASSTLAEAQPVAPDTLVAPLFLHVRARKLY